MSSLSKQKGHKFEDRITNLPNSLITKILSYLPTRDAFKTSVLSTKWERYWTSVTNLHFEVDKEPFRVFPADIPFSRKARRFINWVFLLRDRARLEKFHLKGYRDYDQSLVNAWVVSVLECNPRELDLSGIHIEEPGVLPLMIFHCSTLVVLKLEVKESRVCIPTSVSLPALKTLHLSKLDFSDRESLTRLLSSCPMLETLSLAGFVVRDVGEVLSSCPMLETLRLAECVVKFAGEINITSHVLKSLTIQKLDFTATWDNTYMLVIDTPALEFFSFSDYLAEGYVVSNMNHLIEAEIDFGYLIEGYTYEFREVHTEAIKDFLRGISRVKKLILSWYSMEVLSSCDPVLPQFSSLTYLKLTTAGDPGWRFLPKLLANTPYLKTLHLLQEDDNNMKKTPEISPFHDVPSCFLFHLKEIEIESFGYCESEMEVAEFMLKNANVLEKFTLHSIANSHSDGDDSECYKALLSFLRASSCKVVVL